MVVPFAVQLVEVRVMVKYAWSTVSGVVGQSAVEPGSPHSPVTIGFLGPLSHAATAKATATATVAVNPRGWRIPHTLAVRSEKTSSNVTSGPAARHARHRNACPVACDAASLGRAGPAFRDAPHSGRRPRKLPWGRELTS